jgi:3-methyl-2-oxobutanoate hydroxymethyltransferase
MSTQPTVPARRVTAPDIAARKGAAPIVSLTAYTTQTARLADPHCDFLLVGDSLAMVVHGHDSTVPVSLDLMIAHGQAVVRGTQRALVVVDLPFGSYEASPEQAFATAARVLKETGCGAVKLEGGRRLAPTIRFLVDRGIPVMAHIGLTPQAVNVLGGFKVQGRTDARSNALKEDAEAVAEAGAFAVVLEAMPTELAAEVTRTIPVPTIGIGASAVCDGQILVMEDMLGMAPRVPKFVRRYAEIGAAIEDAIRQYATEVRARAFPAAEHTYAARAPSPKPPDAAG